MSSDIVFVSGEASGDDLSSDVIIELREQDSSLNISAIGGPGLNKAGLESPIDISAIGVVGLIEGLKVYSKVIKLADDVTSYIISENPKAVVLVDSWGFTLRIAQRLKKQAPHIRLIKLIGPQVWASRAGRAKTLAATVDHLLCIHDFEVPFYTPYGLECTVLGNPAISRMDDGDGEAFRIRHGLDNQKTLLLVLPGSRSGEIKRVAPVFAESASRIVDQFGDNIAVFVLVSGYVQSLMTEAGIQWPAGTQILTDTSEKADLMSASTLALACSGTVTTELATQKCPMIVGYSLAPLTWLLAKYLLFKAKFITLANVTMNKEIVPELIQDDFNSDKVYAEALKLLKSQALRDEQKKNLEKAVHAMGWGQLPAHKVAAEKIKTLMT